MMTEHADVAVLKERLRAFDRAALTSVLQELASPIAVELLRRADPPLMVAGIRVKTFVEIVFERGKWDEAVQANGCVNYKAKEDDAGVNAEVPGDPHRIQKHTYKKDKIVRVCGNVAFFPEE